MVFNKYQGNPFAQRAKCEKRKVSVSERKLRKMRNAKWKLDEMELDVLQKETGHLSWDWTFSFVGKKVT